MAKIARQHKDELSVFRQLTVVYLALKSQLLDVFEDIYFRGSRDRHSGFTCITYMQTITYLYTNYGIITDVGIIGNEKLMNAPYDPSIVIDS